MKKTLINSIAILGLSLTSLAQDNIIIKMEKTGISIPCTETADNTDYSSGYAAYEYNVSSATTVHFEMEITNNTGVSKSWRVKRFNQDVTPSDWNSYIKCASLCFPVSSSNPYVTPASDFTSNPQQIRTIELANGDHGLMGFHVVVTSPGTGKYWLYLTDNDNTLHEDSIEIQINYSSLGLNEKGKQEVFNM